MEKQYLLFVGDGQERSKLEKLSADLGIQDRVFFVGEKSDVADWLACMDVYINSSRSEGMSISIMEAMACKIPILANDVGDNRLLVDGERPAGLIVAPGDIPALSEAMTMLAADIMGRKRYSENGRERYLKYHSCSTMCDRYVDLYRRVLEARSR
jgi:glycosyltransferase involved in cell wall biosynthesis